jgi:hypothetical protein
VSEAAEFELSGPMARAIAAGHAVFAKTGYAIERFEVLVLSHPAAFEVVFVPQPAPGEDVVGGSNSAGRELHYWVDRTDFRVQRTTYGR